MFANLRKGFAEIGGRVWNRGNSDAAMPPAEHFGGCGDVYRMKQQRPIRSNSISSCRPLVDITDDDNNIDYVDRSELLINANTYWQRRAKTTAVEVNGAARRRSQSSLDDAKTTTTTTAADRNDDGIGDDGQQHTQLERDFNALVFEATEQKAMAESLVFTGIISRDEAKQSVDAWEHVPDDLIIPEWYLEEKVRQGELNTRAAKVVRICQAKSVTAAKARSANNNGDASILAKRKSLTNNPNAFYEVKGAAMVSRTTDELDDAIRRRIIERHTQLVDQLRKVGCIGMD